MLLRIGILCAIFAFVKLDGIGKIKNLQEQWLSQKISQKISKILNQPDIKHNYKISSIFSNAPKTKMSSMVLEALRAQNHELKFIRDPDKIYQLLLDNPYPQGYLLIWADLNENNQRLSKQQGLIKQHLKTKGFKTLYKDDHQLVILAHSAAQQKWTASTKELKNLLANFKPNKILANTSAAALMEKMRNVSKINKKQFSRDHQLIQEVLLQDKKTAPQTLVFINLRENNSFWQSNIETLRQKTANNPRMLLAYEDQENIIVLIKG